MLKQDIEIGGTYLFVGTDSPKRKHLTGKPFTVTDIKKVPRKIIARRGKGLRTVKTWRIFNEDGIGARADELEPMPKTGFYQCNQVDCRKWSCIEDLTKNGWEQKCCPHCGELVGQDAPDLPDFQQQENTFAYCDHCCTPDSCDDFGCAHKAGLIYHTF
jgi:hypothetical protein